MPPLGAAPIWRCWPARLRPFVTATPWLFGMAVLVHIFCPTAPPWLASETGHLSGIVNLGRAMAGGLAAAPYRYGVGLSGNAVAAMPSVHFGMTTLLLIALWRTPLRWPRLAYSALMLWAIVYTGDHYVVDGIAGSLMAGFAWVLSSRRSP